MASEQEQLEKPELTAWLQEKIASEGGITFAAFMQACLYHPVHGYYTDVRDRIGRAGDFFTSTSVHALFGKLVGRQIGQFWKLLGGGPFTLVEQGAGEGYLALDILESLQQEAPELYRDLQYVLIEISPDHRARQRQRLKEHVEAGKVVWSTLEELQPFVGCFLSNELVDAFPVHLVELTAEGLREVFVVNGEGGFAEELREPSSPRLEEYLAGLPLGLPNGYRTEINLLSRAWMAEVAQKIERGYVLTIDYGYPATERYAPWRNTGTLMCYWQHTTEENPLLRPGCQDITAHIDFSELENVGRQHELASLYFGEQYRFLMGLGFLEELIELQSREPDAQRAQELRLTLKRLIMPESGMGDTFKVLVQGKGVPGDELLCARRIADIPLPQGDFF